MFCKYKEREVVCWHWTHGLNGNDIRFLEIQTRCKHCGKYLFVYLKDWNMCDRFIEKHKDKKWSATCKPVL